jgi:hypothetical protein
MYYRLLADFLVAIHFLWILFMLVGFGLILAGMLFSKKILNWFWFRTLHLAGIIYVGALSMQGKLCPLTIWENQLRAKADQASTYSGSFIIHYIEKLVYLEVNPVLLQVATVSLGVFTLLAYVLAPPRRLKEILKKSSS